MERRSSITGANTAVTCGRTTNPIWTCSDILAHSPGAAMSHSGATVRSCNRFSGAAVTVTWLGSPCTAVSGCAKNLTRYRGSAGGVPSAPSLHKRSPSPKLWRTATCVQAYEDRAAGLETVSDSRLPPQSFLNRFSGHAPGYFAVALVIVSWNTLPPTIVSTGLICSI